MENKPFVEAYEEINARMIRLVGSMSALRKLSDLESSLLDEPELLQQSLRILMENHEFDLAVVLLQQQGTLQQVAMQQWQQTSPPQLAPLLEKLAALAACSFASAGVETQQQMALSDQPCSAICLPLISGEEHIGALCAFSPEADFFTAAHERGLRIYCNFLTQSLINNRLLHNMEALVHERTERLQLALDEARALQQRYEELAIIDQLTGLHNRRFFFPESRALIAAALRYRKPLSLLILDLDGLKRINDRDGQDAGDQVLREVACMLQAEKREADMLACFGGGEFVMLLPETDVDGASVFAHRIHLCLRALNWQFASGTVSTSASSGLSSLQLPCAMPTRQVLEWLLQQAEAALRYSKDHGADQSSHYADIDYRTS